MVAISFRRRLPSHERLQLMKIARWFLVLFLVLWFLHIARTAFISYLGIDPRFYFGMLSVPVAVVTTFAYRMALGPAPGKLSYQLHLIGFVVLITLLAIMGVFYGNLRHNVILEIGLFTIVACFLYLGQYDQVWSDIEAPLTLISAAGLILIGISLSRPGVTLDDSGVIVNEVEFVGRFGVGRLGYDLKPLMGLVPLAFALAYMRKRSDWLRLLGVGGIILAFAFELYFQKRSTTVVLAMYCGWTMLLAALFFRQISIGAVVMIVIGLVAVFSLVGREIITGWVGRYGQENLVTNSRFYEAKSMLDGFNGVDVMIGRGLGGWYDPPLGWKAGLMDVTESGHVARKSLHVGLFYPMLKGGLLLMVVYYGFFVRAFLPKGRRWYQDRFNLAALSVLPVYWLYQGIGGPPSITTLHQAIIVGLCCGRFAIRGGAPQASAAPSETAYIHEQKPAIFAP